MHECSNHIQHEAYRVKPEGCVWLCTIPYTALCSRGVKPGLDWTMDWTVD